MRWADFDKTLDYKKGNDVLDLTILNNLEFLDAMLIQWDVVNIKERKKFLKDAYDFQYPILKRSKTIKAMQELADKARN